MSLNLIIHLIRQARRIYGICKGRCRDAWVEPSLTVEGLSNAGSAQHQPRNAYMSSTSIPLVKRTSLPLWQHLPHKKLGSARLPLQWLNQPRSQRPSPMQIEPRPTPLDVVATEALVTGLSKTKRRSIHSFKNCDMQTLTKQCYASTFVNTRGLQKVERSWPLFHSTPTPQKRPFSSIPVQGPPLIAAAICTSRSTTSIGMVYQTMSKSIPMTRLCPERSSPGRR